MSPASMMAMIENNSPSRPTIREHALDICCLCKVKIAFFASLSAVSGLILASYPSKTVLPAVSAGVFLTASGAGALNHYQERKTDALMARTSGRPLPAGRIRPGRGLFLSLFLIACGCAFLAATGRPAAAGLGLAAVFWYNGFYTWFKRRNRLAAVPGALVGAIPPAIGFIAGGGEMGDPRLAILCFYFITWQIVHFFVHMLAFGGEYEKAGLLSLSSIFTERQLARLTFQWLLAVAVATQLMVLSGVVLSPLVEAAAFALSLCLGLEAAEFMIRRRIGDAGTFKKINAYMLCILLLIIMDGIARSSACRILIQIMDRMIGK